MPIIKSILDDDLYKFSTQNAVLQYKQNVPVHYEFNNRRKSNKFNDVFLHEFNNELEQMADLTCADQQIRFFQNSCPFLGNEYFAYLKNYKFNPDEVKVSLNSDAELNINIDGVWDRTILWEVPLMAIISELYFKFCDTDWNHDMELQRYKIRQKAAIMDKLVFTDFGTRRRRNYETQQQVVEMFKAFCPNFIGTSNVHIAELYNVKPLGTFPHEWIMGISTLEGLSHANRHAMTIWSDIYKGDLGTALTDTYGTKAFWNDFEMRLAKLFDSIRHDSGCPFKFTDMAVEAYKKLRIDPTTKTAIFSDGLDCNLAVQIAEYCKNKIRCSFGIGTHLTNDYEKMDGTPSQALNMVIKLLMCAGKYCVKLGDNPAKAIGQKDAIRVARYTFEDLPLDSEM
jgi:nicotinate phosphoribosyltransferase